jgi:hypothetical protein
MTRCALVALAFLVLTAGAPAQPPDLSGRWSGYWVSDTNGHTGPLHARFRQLDADTYRVAFRGRFAKVVPFWYTTKLHVTGTGDGVILLAASQQLPLVGEYRTAAAATETNFDATFTSRKDSGRFVMTRRR